MGRSLVLADWRAGRNAIYQLAALTIGARLAIADASVADAGEHGERILARLVAIERQLGLVEKPSAPKISRRRPVD